jgi:O-antigen biosynthesis protein
MSAPSPAVSVVIPVKNGKRYLAELLDAVSRQRVDGEMELLVVDSGSSDGSPAIARSAGARVLEIEPSQFGHGSTRNMAAGEARGERIVFLTQDATPASEDWLAQLVAPLDEQQRVGLAFGPHLPREDTSPMVARELEQFFGSFSPNGQVQIDDGIEAGNVRSGFFSNVNSALLRSCWNEVRFRDVDYAEDQAFARDAAAAGWKKAYVPAAAVRHAHDFAFTTFMRRYFDEYAGLRDTIGHVEPASPRRALATVRKQVRGDVRYMRDAGYGRSSRIAWGARSGRHHAGRALFSALGSRAERLPEGLRKRLSLEGRGGEVSGGLPATERVKATGHRFDYVSEHYRRQPAPLAAPSPDDGEGPLHIAWVIPPFRRGSGGHMTIFNIVEELERKGHSCSIWVHDPTNRTGGRGAIVRREIEQHFAPLQGGVFIGFDDWQGADVALATGWQTAYPLSGLDDCRLKAYMVQDYEPDFYPASAERVWAEDTYSMGYPCVTASPWLTEMLRGRFGATADHFELGVDHEVYGPQETQREPATVVHYARPITPRRGTELAILALAELARMRSDVRIVLFGDTEPPPAGFEFEFAGIVDERALASLYNKATVGLVISLTNYSRIPKEMMACGLPVVDVCHQSVGSVFGRDGSLIELADPQPIDIAERLAGLLDSPSRRDEMAARARDFVGPMTWEAAAAQIESMLRQWLRGRWQQALAEGQSRSASVNLARR